MKTTVYVKCIKKGKRGEWPPTDIRRSALGELGPMLGEEEVCVTRELHGLNYFPRMGAVVRTKAIEGTPLRIESVEIDTDLGEIRLCTGSIRSESEGEHAALIARFTAAGWHVEEP